MSDWLQRLWYRQTPPPAPLAGLSSIYAGVAARVAASRKAKAVKLPVPVIVVGNLSVGGTGKTPLVVWLVEQLSAQGLRPGIVSRGYGGCAPAYPLRVTAATDVRHSGDEPALLARRLAVPVAVAPDRVAAAQLLLDAGGIEVLIADDGLQHYRLARDLEICVVDGSRGFGNGALLPAGPLREPPERLRDVDLVVVNGGGWRPADAIAAPVVDMRIALAEAVALDGGERRPLSAFAASPVHAVAGIGNPLRFFDALRGAGLDLRTHPFPDHHGYTEMDLPAEPPYPVLMTEKDAVKCQAWARPGLWSVPAAACFDEPSATAVRKWLDTHVLPLLKQNG